VLAIGLLAARASSAQDFVPGEVLVKFRPGTAVARAGAEAQPPLAEDRALRTALEEVLGPVGIPLLPKQKTSGGELLLIADGRALIERITQEGHRLAEGREVEWVPPASPTVSPRFFDFRVTGDPGTSLRRVAEDLSEASDLPLVVRGTPDGESRLSLDLAALTRQAVERLREIAEVEHAEVNLVLRLFGPGP